MKLLWEPAIYEHKAALIGRDVLSVANSASLLVEAVLAELEIYRADRLTVGVDVYNLEAEALGATLTTLGPTSCPDLESPPWSLEALPELQMPDLELTGRLRMMIEAGQKLVQKVGTRAHVRVAASGPVSMASKLVGLENLVLALASEELAAARLLEFTLAVARAWCGALRRAGLEVVVFDSAVSPPMFSPTMYEQFALPLHRQLLQDLEASGQQERPLIIGGDTTLLLPLLKTSGTNSVICDSRTEATTFHVPGHWRVRRNVDPRQLAEGDLATLASTLVRDLQRLPNPIAGTGILAYDADPHRFHQLRNAVEALWNQASRES